MASVSKDTNGNKRVLVIVDGKRHTIYLGNIPMDAANSVCSHVQTLAGCKLSRQGLTTATAEWLRDLDDGLRAKLAKIGLAKLQESRGPVALGKYIDEYIEKRVDIKPKTVLVLKLVKDRLFGFFGAGRDLTAITTGEAVDCRLSWIKKGLAENTVRKSCSIAKQFFADAIRRKIISENPFKSKVLPCAVRGNDDRFHFVSREETQKLIDTCAPDNVEWKLLIALARYGGLRTPSESLSLRWDGVNFEAGKIKVLSPKTEHHKGKEFRWIPLYPELEPYLTAAHTQAIEGAIFVISHYRDTTANLSTQLGRIADRAGISLWPKPWSNMRISRQVELADEFPAHVVSQWQGNSQQVATAFYLKTTEDHFKKALAGKTTQKTTQCRPVQNNLEGSGDIQDPKHPNHKSLNLQDVTTRCDLSLFRTNNIHRPRQDLNL
jgi:integrase